MAARRSAGRSGENLGVPRLRTPSGTVTTRVRADLGGAVARVHAYAAAGVLDLGHLHTQAYVDPGSHRVDQTPVARRSDRSPKKSPSYSFSLPNQRSECRSAESAASASTSARSACRARRAASPVSAAILDEGLDRVRHRRVAGRARPRSRRQRVRERLEGEVHARVDLGCGEPTAAPAVEGADAPTRGSPATTRDAGLLGEVAQRVPDRVVDPRPARGRPACRPGRRCAAGRRCGRRASSTTHSTPRG